MHSKHLSYNNPHNLFIGMINRAIDSVAAKVVLTAPLFISQA